MVEQKLKEMEEQFRQDLVLLIAKLKADAGPKWIDANSQPINRMKQERQ